jgi:aminoglycoside phosphotransferase (APT) family kinase protein
MVVIKVKGFKAGYTGAGGWKAEIPELTKELNRATQELDPRTAYVVDWENWVAEQMLDLYEGSEVVSLNDFQSEPGVVY